MCETIVEETNNDGNLQLAENQNVQQNQKEKIENEYEIKRGLLEKTKIVKQTWSISEIYQKIKEKKLILNPDYQRNLVWDREKRTSFIESLYMGIIIPPLYVVEVPSENILEETKYEVVDGKQRLTSILDFVKGDLKLDERYLEYYADIFACKTFLQIKDIAKEETSEMLSSVLDIYVITAKSPEFTKYDIFARLNKGAEKLKVNEIRRAIYKSDVLDLISKYIEDQLENNKIIYKRIFTPNDIKRYEDYGRFYRSISFYLKSDIQNGEVRKYNSRPREMINGTLQELQNGKLSIDKDELTKILDATINLKIELVSESYADYIIDALIPFVVNDYKKIKENIQSLVTDSRIMKTLEKSQSTTSNVNARLQRVKQLLEEL